MNQFIRQLFPVTVTAFSLFLMTACGKQESVVTAPAESASTPAESTTALADPNSPCRLLTAVEVSKFFPASKAGVPERTREKYGITACEWESPTGRFVAQVWKAEPGAVENEIKGLSQGFIDPLMPAARDAIRYESVAGVGDKAMIVLETQNAQKGILSDAGMLMTQRGDQLLMLMSSELPRRERAEAITALTTLGRSAVERL